MVLYAGELGDNMSLTATLPAGSLWELAAPKLLASPTMSLIMLTVSARSWVYDRAM